MQGVGHVGLNLCRLLHEAGARLTVADVNRQNLQLARDELPVTEVTPVELLFSDVDVLAPCALGNILTSQTIPNIQANIVAGAANNQLSTEQDGARLAARDILYAPDYVINAGGIINVAHEYFGNSSEEKVLAEVGQIPERLDAIFAEARETGSRPTSLPIEWRVDLSPTAGTRTEMTRKSRLHIPRPSARPGDKPDFSYLELVAGGQRRQTVDRRAYARHRVPEQWPRTRAR